MFRQLKRLTWVTRLEQRLTRLALFPQDVIEVGRPFYYQDLVRRGSMKRGSEAGVKVQSMLYFQIYIKQYKRKGQIFTWELFSNLVVLGDFKKLFVIFLKFQKYSRIKELIPVKIEVSQIQCLFKNYDLNVFLDVVRRDGTGFLLWDWIPVSSRRLQSLPVCLPGIFPVLPSANLGTKRSI